MNRSNRRVLAKETLQILENGFYQATSGDKVWLKQALEEMVDSTVTIFGDREELVSPAIETKYKTLFEVTGESVCDTIYRLAAKTPSEESIGCLNFASAKNAGGGFLNGSQAQEEALARSSGLYTSLRTQQDNYYEPNRNHTSCLYLDRIIYSPKVPFFRDDGGDLVDEPAAISVVTAPAPNAGAVRKNEPENVSRVESIFYNRAEMVLHTFATYKIDHLILGAWGCGVFQNDPKMVAEMWQSLLGKGGRFEGGFKSVVFAIYDPRETSTNREVFEKLF